MTTKTLAVQFTRCDEIATAIHERLTESKVPATLGLYATASGRPTEHVLAHFIVDCSSGVLVQSDIHSPSDSAHDVADRMITQLIFELAKMKLMAELQRNAKQRILSN
jgi:hypothetical protein